MTNARDHFIEHLGLTAQTEGLPRISGQILGYLIVEGEARTLTQMTEALKISKGSASTNARLLEHQGSVRRVSVLGQRQDAYEAVDDPGLQTLIGMADRFRANATSVEAIAAQFGDGDAAARGRVEKMAGFYRESAAFLDEWTERMRARCTAESHTAAETHIEE